ncbi:OmpA family protein [Celeribacter arenosi]|uniref:OmpA-like domain-containing protein n=1 Tax=Celeribacter arenosi TaxID=792649 RepID=A0ABP7K5A3_9RHOB
MNRGFRGLSVSVSATALTLGLVTFSGPLLSQEAAAPEFESCALVAPPCLTEDNLVRLDEGDPVSVQEALTILGVPEAADTVADDAVVEPEVAPVVAAPQEAPLEAEPATVEDMPADTAEQPVDEPAPAEGAADAVAVEEMPAEVVEEVPVEEVPAAEVPAEEVPAEEMPAEEMPTEAEPVEQVPAGNAEVMEGEASDEVAEEPAVDEAMTEAVSEPAPTQADLVEELPELDPEAEATAEAEAAASDELTGDNAPLSIAEETEAVNVVEEQITEETARSSGEEFETTASGKATPEAQAAKKSGGLSNFEKFLLGAAGAVALNEILGQDEEIVANTGDRVVIERDGQLRVLKDDDELLRRPGTAVSTATFDDGSTRTTLTREDGSQVITYRAPDGRALRRDRILVDGTRVVLFDDTQAIEAVDVTTLDARPTAAKTQRVDDLNDEDALRAALAANAAQDVERRYSLNQVRNIRAVRELAPEIELTSVNFATGSSAITALEAEELAALGRAMRNAIEENPREMFLVEGHTDAVGNAGYNLALSDRRAESLALALTEYFDVPPENMIVQGYGERYLKVRTLDAERANRRAAVRIITPLLTMAAAN